MGNRIKELENRFTELEKSEERRQRNLQNLIKKQLDSEKRRQELETIFH